MYKYVIVKPIDTSTSTRRAIVGIGYGLLDHKRILFDMAETIDIPIERLEIDSAGFVEKNHFTGEWNVGGNSIGLKVGTNEYSENTIIQCIGDLNDENLNKAIDGTIVYEADIVS